MTRSRSPEDAEYWLSQAAERLEHARGYDAGRNARIYCEQAHYAAEFSIKAVIISRGGSFATSHNIKELVDTARALGETIPAEVQAAKGLTLYAGAGRYEFDRNPEADWVGEDAYDQALGAAEATVTWARGRIDDILGAHDRR